MKLSVVIPTHNNAKILPECLRRILGQTVPKEDYEVLLINDASTDETVRVAGEIKGIRAFNLTENHGPSYARNLGIKETQSPIVVFIQDDILVPNDFLERHLKFHEDHPAVDVVLVGQTGLDPSINPTPFAKWWDDGHQFKYQRIDNREQITDRPYLNFYPTNLSVKKEFLIKCGLFDETFFIDGHIGYEDTELGYRLWQAGMKLFYDPSLTVSHHHLRTLKDICNQSYYKGQLAKVLYSKHPELEKVFKDDLKFKLSLLVVNPATIKILEPLALYCEKRFRSGLLFWVVCRYYYNHGYKTYS